MSTLVAQTISNGTVSTSTANGVNGAKAWINFNGTAGTIRASYNVTSITKNTTGDYTLNFTNAFVDANYSWGFSGNNSDDIATGGNSTVANTTVANQTASSLRIQTRFQVTTVSGVADMTLITVQVFR
jgi:hypothetical protein